MDNKDAIHAAADALASPQADCLELKGEAESVYETLVEDYPSFEVSISIALSAKEDVYKSCQILLQYGTAAEIKQEANEDMQTM